MQRRLTALAFVVSAAACGTATTIEPVPEPLEGGIAFEAGQRPDAATGHGVVALASAQMPFAVAVDATRAYWSDSVNDGNVMRCEIADCAATTLRLVNVGGLSQPMALALDATNVSWIDAYGTVATCPKTGCGTPTILAQQTGGSPLGLASDGTTLYWAGANGILACETAGCAKTPRLVVAGQILAFDIGVDDTSVYWTEPAGNVSRCLKGGCPSASTIALDQASPRKLTIETRTSTGRTKGTALSCDAGSRLAPRRRSS